MRKTELERKREAIEVLQKATNDAIGAMKAFSIIAPIIASNMAQINIIRATRIFKERDA